MADNVQLGTPTGVGDVVAADDVGGTKYQRIKIALGADGAFDGDVDDAFPMPVNIKDSCVQVDDAAFTPATGKILMIGALADDTVPDSVDEGDGGALRMSPNRSLHVTVMEGEDALAIDASGKITVIAEDGGSSLTIDGTVTIQDGGNVISVDDGASSLTVDNAALSVVGGGVEATALRVTIASDSTGVLSVDDNGSTLSVDDAGGSLTVDVGTALPAGDNNIGNVDIASAIPAGTNVIGIVRLQDSGGSEIDIDSGTGAIPIIGTSNHGTGKSGKPLRNGVVVRTTLPTAEVSDDQVDAISDRYGRQLVTEFDYSMYKNKAASYTTTQTGTVLLDPTTGTLPIITHMTIGTSGTSAGRVTIWYGANADSTYTEGTDRCIFDGTLTPSASATPGVVFAGQCFLPAGAANDEIHVTTTGDVDVNISVWYVEVTP